MTKESIKSFIIKRRIDIIVIASLLLLSLIVLLIISLTKKEGATVRVEIDGEIVGEYSLDIDKEYSLNGGTNTLTVKDGEAYMTYSDCPDHTCERTGKIRFVGETIVCLPNKVSVTVIGDSEDGVDLVS
jgi:hypothetical protein